MKVIKKTLLLLILTVYIFSGMSGTALAQEAQQDQSKEQMNLLRQGIYRFDIAGCNISSGQTDSHVSADTDGPIYQSGITGPYILEQWAIHTLKALAQKQSIDESKTVTKEHVVALLAFALGEGGDINNTSSVFNPLNTGLNAPELLAGANARDGTQSFKSFDAGVEGTARTMIGSYQNRTAKTLSNPDSTASDFMKALTYFNRHQGNKFWAAASLPPNQDSYYQERLNLVKQVRADYKGIASLVIGTPELEQQTGKKEPSKLVFADGGTDTETATGAQSSNCSCSVASEETDATAGTLVGENNREKAFKFFTANGMTPIQAAGAVGNFMQESTRELDPTLVNESGHQGIAQWDSASRWPALVEFARKQKGDDNSPRNLLIQLKFAIQEDDMKPYLQYKPKDIADATRKFDEVYERSGGSAMENRIKYAEEVHAAYASGTPDSPTPAAAPQCPDGGGAKAFVSEGYAWPVDLNKADSSAGYPLPCRQASCHHDGSAAFDISHKDTVKDIPTEDKKAVGKAVYAITDGELAKVNVYKGITGCYALQFRGKDGFVYWYGHLRKPVSEQAGKKFKAGEKIAEIGERDCTGNKSYPHLHIDRGSPKGEFGGSVCCRDSGMNDVINGLYEKLP